MNEVSVAMLNVLRGYTPLINAGIHSYIDKAKAGEKPPYIIIQFQAGSDEYTQQGEDLISADWLIKGVSVVGQGDIGTRMSNWIRDALNNQMLSIQNYRLLRCWRRTIVKYSGELVGDPYWYEGGLFAVRLA